MAETTAIEWTDATWNPVTGCTKVSPGCDRCYAETFTERWRGIPGHHFTTGFDVTLRPDRLDLPRHWRRPRRVFVNSMADLFHEQVSDEYIGSVFDAMAATPHHIYQVLTKRHARMRSLLTRWAGAGWRWRRHDHLWCGPVPGPLPNVWLGVSVENQRWADTRLPALAATPAAVRFVSCEPLLGPVDLSDWLPIIYGENGSWDPAPARTGPAQLDWVIVGGESGPRARPIDEWWIGDLIDQARGAHIPVFVKQLGTGWARQHGHAGRGGDPTAWPAELRVRDVPASSGACA
jgi:protein gp37